MHSNLKRFTRTVAGVAALAAVAAMVPATNLAQALPPGTPPAGAATLTPATGNSLNNFNISIPVGASCPGDGPAGYRWGTYITPATNDPAAMVFDGLGSPTGQPAITSSLRAPTGQLVRAVTPGLTNGLIAIPPAGFNFTSLPLTPGLYNIGIACTLNTAGVTNNERYWNTVIEVTTNTTSGGPNNFTYGPPAVPAAPVAPVLGATLTTGNGTLTGSFTATASNPATTGFTVTATPTTGAPVVLPVAAAGPFTLTGLTNGTAYAVTVTATNSLGTSPASNSVSGTPGVAAQPAIPLTLTPGANQVTASFTAPTGVVPTGYTLTVSPAPGAPTPASFTIPAAVGLITQVVPNLTPGTPYTFTLTPAYTAPDSGTPTVGTASPTSAQVIQQRISVTRPVGALILTQRCGVYGDLPATTAVDAFPGYPVALPAATATGDQTGTSPDISPAPAGQPANTVDADPEFGDYPFPSPATYPTECGVALGSASLITSGALAGQYYAADGRLNEVTVSDLRDTNAGWTVTGTMGDFIGVTSATNTFDGDYLGWIPSVQNNTVGQTVTAGAAVLPGTGVTTGSGLGSGQPLAVSPAGSSLGVAQLDARLQLLFPTTVKSDDYNGILGFTVA